MLFLVIISDLIKLYQGIILIENLGISLGLYEIIKNGKVITVVKFEKIFPVSSVRL